MEKFNISKVFDNVQAMREMDYQYEKLMNVGTSQARCNRFLNMLALYEKFPCLKSIWEYVEDAWQYTKKFVRRVITRLEDIIQSKEHDYFYIMRFYRHGRHIFDKVGSSARPLARKEQHLNYYENVDSADILLCVDTGAIKASSLEDKVRSYFIRKYGEENFLAKDRFLCKVDIEDIKSKIPACLAALRAAEIY